MPYDSSRKRPPRSRRPGRFAYYLCPKEDSNLHDLAVT
jgi:hypothetical protein